MSTEIEQTELDGGASNGAADEIVARAGGFRRWAPQVLAMLLAAYGIWAFVNVLEVRQVRDRMHLARVMRGVRRVQEVVRIGRVKADGRVG